MPLSLDRLQVGHSYEIRNFGEVVKFQVLRRLSDQDYLIKQIDTLEKYELGELIRFGRGKDFNIEEMID